MEGVLLIAGLSIVTFFFLYLFKNLDEEHFILKLLFLTVALQFMFMIAGTTAIHKDDCSLLINTTNTSVSGTGNMTVYDYGEYCMSDTTGSSTRFLIVMTYISRIFWAYLIIYIIMTFGPRFLKFIGDIPKWIMGRKKK